MSERALGTNALGAGAVRLIVVAADPVSFYLGIEHAVYHDRRAGTFKLIARERGTRDLWSNRRLLNQAGDVERYTDGAREVWLIRPVEPKQQPFTVDQVWGARARGQTIHCISIDGRLEVVRIALSGPARPPRPAAPTVIPRCASWYQRPLILPGPARISSSTGRMCRRNSSGFSHIGKWPSSGMICIRAPAIAPAVRMVSSGVHE